MCISQRLDLKRGLPDDKDDQVFSIPKSLEFTQLSRHLSPCIHVNYLYFLPSGSYTILKYLYNSSLKSPQYDFKI